MEAERPPASLHAMNERLRARDSSVFDDHIRRTLDRFERLACRMLRNRPVARAREETGDAVQGSLARLAGALREATPLTDRDFLGLAAEHVRRELLDLARRYRPIPVETLGDRDFAGSESGELDRWAAFQQAVERLPTEHREVFCLAFYLACAHPEIAGLLNISERRVRRVWAGGCLRVHACLGGRLPAP